MKNKQSDFQKVVEKGLGDVKYGRTISVQEAREHLKLEQITDLSDDFLDLKDQVKPDFTSYRYPSNS